MHRDQITWLTPEEATLRSRRDQWFTEQFYALTLGTSKLAMLGLYWRLFSAFDAARYAIIFLVCAVLLWVFIRVGLGKIKKENDKHTFDIPTHESHPFLACTHGTGSAQFLILTDMTDAHVPEAAPGNHPMSAYRGVLGALPAVTLLRRRREALLRRGVEQPCPGRLHPHPARHAPAEARPVVAAEAGRHAPVSGGYLVSLLLTRGGHVLSETCLRLTFVFSCTNSTCGASLTVLIGSTKFDAMAPELPYNIRVVAWSACIEVNLSILSCTCP